MLAEGERKPAGEMRPITGSDLEESSWQWVGEGECVGTWEEGQGEASLSDYKIATVVHAT